MARVVLAVSSFPRVSETFIFTKFMQLLDEGWDVYVACSHSDQAQWRLCPELLNIPAVRRRVRVAWPHRPRWLVALLAPLVLFQGLIHQPRTTWRYLKRGWEKFGWQIFRHYYLDHHILALKPSLIHWEFGALAVGRMHLQELLQCKAVASFRGYDLNHVGVDRPDHYREVWDRIDGVHFLGNDLWQRGQKRGCPPDILHVLIPPAVNPEIFDPQGRKQHQGAGSFQRPLRILSVGRLEWKKGYEYSLNAVKLLQNQGIPFEYRIVGEGEYLGPLAFTRHQLGLGQVVQFLGGLSHQKVKEQMLWADVFLHAAVTEGFCNAVLEAQAMMLPVVCTDAGGLIENVLDGETGFVVPRRNPAAMAEKLVLLAQDSDCRQQMAQAGRHRVLTSFQLRNQTLAFELFYKQIINLTS